MLRYLLIAAALALALAPALPAVDLPDKPPSYALEKFRAEWRMKPLGEALDEIAKWIEKPVWRSDAVAKRADEPVALVDDHKVPLRETLEMLERVQHLRITVEPLRLRVETEEDYRDRNRRLVDLSLRDYGIFSMPRDFPGRELGWHAGGVGGNGGIAMFSDAGPDHPGGPADDVIERIAKSSNHGGMELRGNGNVFVWVTPEEEAELRKTLDETYRATIRRSDWRVVFGTLPAADAPQGGLVTRADADALAAKLKDAHALALTSLDGQRVNAGTEQQRAYLADADIVSGHLDPKVAVLSAGRAVDLRADCGFGFSLVAFAIAWADPLPDAPPAEVRNPGGQRSGETTVELKKDETGPVTATVGGDDASPHRGESMSLQQPAQWVWEPRGECFLAKGTAMVFVSEHPAGRAVIVLEETTP